MSKNSEKVVKALEESKSVLLLGMASLVGINNFSETQIYAACQGFVCDANLRGKVFQWLYDKKEFLKSEQDHLSVFEFQLISEVHKSCSHFILRAREEVDCFEWPEQEKQEIESRVSLGDAEVGARAKLALMLFHFAAKQAAKVKSITAPINDYFNSISCAFIRKVISLDSRKNFLLVLSKVFLIGFIKSVSDYISRSYGSKIASFKNGLMQLNKTKKESFKMALLESDKDSGLDNIRSAFKAVSRLKGNSGKSVYVSKSMFHRVEKQFKAQQERDQSAVIVST